MSDHECSYEDGDPHCEECYELNPFARLDATLARFQKSAEDLTEILARSIAQLEQDAAEDLMQRAEWDAERVDAYHSRMQDLRG